MKSFFRKNPFDSPSSLGQWGEEKAARYLQKKGFRLLERNWNHPLGELDLVCLKEETLIIVEVKTRHGKSCYPFEALTPKKQRKLRQLTEIYCYKHHWEGEVRIDVVGIIVGQSLRLIHLEGVV